MWLKFPVLFFVTPSASAKFFKKQVEKLSISLNYFYTFNNRKPYDYLFLVGPMLYMTFKNAATFAGSKPGKDGNGNCKSCKWVMESIRRV